MGGYGDLNAALPATQRREITQDQLPLFLASSSESRVRGTAETGKEARRQFMEKRPPSSAILFLSEGCDWLKDGRYNPETYLVQTFADLFQDGDGCKHLVHGSGF